MDGSDAKTTEESVVAWRSKFSAFAFSKLIGSVEFVAIGVLSIVISLLHINVMGGTNLTLLFDGFGFLATTAGCMSVFNSDLLQQVLLYIFSGFNETSRLALAERMAPAAGLVRCGPLLPGLIASAYFFSGKPPTPQFWQVCTWAMWATQAFTIALIWLSARLAWNVKVARIAAFIALTYSGFIINGSRLATETQACFAIIATVCLFLWYSKNDFRSTKSLVSGLSCGLILGFLALARPPFLLLPILLVVALLLSARWLKVSFPFSSRWIAGTVCGAAILLMPWALCNKILTGKASITIDRFAVYNLYTGLNTKTLGFDVLPGDLVEHPERYKTPLKEALSEVVQNAAHDPGRAVEMLLLKPTRLLDSPWNDYQLSCYGEPWLLQRYFHQVIMLFAFLAMFLVARDAMKQGTLSSWSRAIVLNLVVLYNFIHCLFISMSRYTYPIMPVVIVLAAAGIMYSWSHVRARWNIIVCAFCLPFFSLWIEYLSAPDIGLVPHLMDALGVTLFSFFISLIASAGLFFFMFGVSRHFEENRVFKIAIISGAALAFVAVFFAMIVGMKQIPFPVVCSNETQVTVPITVEKIDENSSWFVVFDTAFEGFSLDVLKCCRLSVNGNELNADVLPLMGIDASQRDSFVYQKAFAHSGAKDLTDLRQWFCIAVPRKLLQEGSNEIRFATAKIDPRPGSQPPRVFFMNDFVEGGKRVSPLDIRKFSWTKGFTVNPPLDMRMVEFPPAAEKIAEKLKARLFLLEVNSDVEHLQVKDDGDTVMFGDRSIDKRGESRVVNLNVEPSQLSHSIDGIKNGAGNAIRFKLSGDLLCEAGDGNVSIALITRSGSKETMAPLAPELIPCGKQSSHFEFVDLIPVGDKTDFTCSSRILIAGRPWWEVLQYGSYRVDKPVRVDHLKLEAAVTNMPDLSRQSWRIHK